MNCSLHSCLYTAERETEQTGAGQRWLADGFKRAPLRKRPFGSRDRTGANAFEFTSADLDDRPTQGSRRDRAHDERWKVSAHKGREDSDPGGDLVNAGRPD